MPSIEGIYQRKSGHRFAYTYRADWSTMGSIVVYDASVWREGLLISKPRGQMRRQPSQAVPSILRAIESAIEASQIE